MPSFCCIFTAMDSPTVLTSLMLIILVQSYEYISQDGSASQSSTYYYGNLPLTADLAITGGPTHNFYSKSCSTTGTNKKYVGWWMLTFPYPVYIKNIKILYRDETPKRLAGYYLYITNTSATNMAPKPPDTDLCYHDVGPALPSITQNVQCHMLGQHVVIYNDRNETSSYNKPGYSVDAVLELCDVQVFGCSKFFFGPNCIFNCSSKCFEQQCYPGNGSCILGCNCLGDNCNNATSCTEGCKSGFGGPYCNQHNIATSGIPTKSSTEDKVDAELAIDGDRTVGSCSKVSIGVTSWQLDLQNTSVIRSIYLYINATYEENNYPVLYVSNSSEIRSDYSRLNITFNANITSLPSLIFTADTFITARYVIYEPGASNVDLCEVEIIGCTFGFYGQDCNKTCSKQCDGTCHPDTGVCVGGCLYGWVNPYCNESCQAGTFGRQCLESCHCYNTSITCNNVDGMCPPGGCDRGYKGSNCSTGCLNGTYGFNCNETCEGCLSDHCSNQDGKCTDQSGCKPGWQHDLPLCKTVCENGFFGNCSQECHCKTGICDKVKGYCSENQCDRGWMGTTCSEECELGHYGFDCENTCGFCMNTSCEIVEGNCTNGCISGYEGIKCLPLLVQQKEPEKSSMLGGIIAAAACVVIIVIILAVLIRSRRRKQKQKGEVKHKHISQAEQNLVYATDDESEGLYHNVVLNTNDQFRIPVSAINTLITKMEENNSFEQQFKILPKGLIQPHIEAAKPENKAKNRYAETWPYDHSRVVLKGKNDYINASYIDSYTKNKTYIATQGPKKETISDFWQMIWQENVEIIVMVTQLEEGKKKKCEQYWPESKENVMAVGIYDLIVAQEKCQTVNVYRQIHIMNRQTKDKRILHHYHFTEWPDHGVPDKVKLISFYRKVKKTKTSLKGPIVVHCSAGVGRTGTFIAIDALYERGLETGYVDVMEYVQIMRKDRLNMIQTEEQYTAVFEALSEAFTIPVFTIETNTFLEYLKDKSKLERNIKQQYQKLEEMRPVYDSQSFRAAHLKENITKNAVKEILPHDKYRPYLMSYDKSQTDYINAVIVPEYHTKTNLFITQYPLTDTVKDFWTMIYDHDCTAIVLLESLKQDVHLVADEDDTSKFKHFNITQNATPFTNSVNVNIICHDNTKKSREIKILTLDDWKKDNIPDSNNQMFELIKDLSNWREAHPGSVAVVCRNGCGRSGLFAALHLVLQKLDMDDEVDIFQVVRAIRIRRPEFISDFKQYEFIYQCIENHLTADSIYANV